MRVEYKIIKTEIIENWVIIFIKFQLYSSNKVNQCYSSEEFNELFEYITHLFQEDKIKDGFSTPLNVISDMNEIKEYINNYNFDPSSFLLITQYKFNSKISISKRNKDIASMTSTLLENFINESEYFLHRLLDIKIEIQNINDKIKSFITENNNKILYLEKKIEKLNQKKPFWKKFWVK